MRAQIEQGSQLARGHPLILERQVGQGEVETGLRAVGSGQHRQAERADRGPEQARPVLGEAEIEERVSAIRIAGQNLREA